MTPEKVSGLYINPQLTTATLVIRTQPYNRPIVNINFALFSPMISYNLSETVQAAETFPF